MRIGRRRYDKGIRTIERVAKPLEYVDSWEQALDVPQPLRTSIDDDHVIDRR
jgi:hypothetical protein